MRSKIVLIVPLFIFALAGCSKNDEGNAEKVVPVKIFKVRTESISRYIRATGSVSGEQDVILYSKIPERVEKIHVIPGQAVLKDQILVRQKNEILKQGLEIAGAALKTAEGQAKLTASDFERMDKLYAEKAISPQQYDQAKIAKETAEHTLDQAKSAHEQAREQFESSFIKAPFDGIAAAVYVEENQMINAGQPVVQVLSPAKMKSKIYLTGADIHYAKVGQRVLIKFPAIPDEEFSGRVEKINTAIDQTSRSLEVEIAFLSKDRRIKSGMFGEFLIEVQRVPDGLVVPEPALISQTEIKIDRETGLQSTVRKYYLFVIEQHKAKMKEVKTGIANDGQIEIQSGLALGDSVVIVGQNIVKEGQTVNVID
jgi:membrane fusion protein (multidrug efflux system)